MKISEINVNKRLDTGCTDPVQNIEICGRFIITIFAYRVLDMWKIWGPTERKYISTSFFYWFESVRFISFLVTSISRFYQWGFPYYSLRSPWGDTHLRGVTWAVRFIVIRPRVPWGFTHLLISIFLLKCVWLRTTRPRPVLLEIEYNAGQFADIWAN